MEEMLLTSEKAQKMLDRLKEDWNNHLYIEFYHVEDMEAMVNRIRELEEKLKEYERGQEEYERQFKN
jgi:hypothetical protein